MIVVAACTYKRPDGLKRLLDSIAALDRPADEECRVVIVDNDGDDPRVAAVAEAFGRESGWLIHLVVERAPGIAEARNAAFREARRLGARTLAMIDDDEWVTPRWLTALIATRDATGAKVVGGPVRPVFSKNRAHLARHARFWSVERDFLAGRPFVFCTCNFLVEMEAVTFLGDEVFDRSFGLTGGSDTVFFRHLFARGVPMAWSEEAAIEEEIPDSRATIAWLRQRRYRFGQVARRWEQVVPVEGDLPPLVKTLAAIARLPFYPFMARERSSFWLAWLLEADKVRGRIAAQLGSRYAEYGRPATKPLAKPDTSS